MVIGLMSALKTGDLTKGSGQNCETFLRCCKGLPSDASSGDGGRKVLGMRQGMESALEQTGDDSPEIEKPGG